MASCAGNRTRRRKFDSFVPQFYIVLQCSGYHVCLSRRRSRVRVPSALPEQGYGVFGLYGGCKGRPPSERKTRTTGISSVGQSATLIRWKSLVRVQDARPTIWIRKSTQDIQLSKFSIMYDGLNTFGFPLSFHFRHAQQTFLAFVKWLRRFPFKKITLVRIRQANNVSSILKRMFQ